MNMSIQVLFCPDCGTNLNNNGISFFCEKCTTSFPIIYDIPHFINYELFWSEPGITADVLKDINSRLSIDNWRKVLSNHESEKVREHYFFINDLDRARWHKILNLSPDSVILDLGAGMGTISHALSRHYKHVVALEPVQLRCEFMKNRFRQEKIENVTIIRGDSEKIPFPDNYFDHIVMNGVLEWVPYTYKHLNPRNAQLFVLRKLNRLLKPGGSVSIGIENRLGYQYFLGYPDCHIGVKYVTIMPRFIADFICKKSINDIYRPYLYSWRGIRKLLSEADYKSIKVYCSLPSYNEPEYTIEVDSKSDKYYEYIWQTKNRKAVVIKKALSRLGILKYFCYAFRVVACKNLIT